MGESLNCSIASDVIVAGISGVQTTQSSAKPKLVRDHVLLTRSRAHAVNSNSIPNLLIGQSPGKCNDRTLGRCVIQQVRTANIGIDGSAVDDGRTVLQVRNSILRQPEKGVDVGIKGVFPLSSIRTCQCIMLASRKDGCPTHSSKSLISPTMFWYAALFTRMSIPPKDWSAMSITLWQFFLSRRSMAKQ